MSSNFKYFYTNQKSFATIFLRFSMEEQSFLLLLISFKVRKHLKATLVRIYC